jgi:hypothetical protein
MDLHGLVLGLDANRELAERLAGCLTLKESVLFSSSDRSRHRWRHSNGACCGDQRWPAVSRVLTGRLCGDLRSGGEVRHWSGVSDDDTEDLGFAGFVCGFRLTWQPRSPGLKAAKTSPEIQGDFLVK